MSDAKIVLATDKERFSELTSKFFDSSPVLLFQSSTLENTLATARRERPQLVLMDAELPGLDSAGCCSAFKADDELRDIPFVILAPSDTGDGADLLRQAGCDDILTTPLDAGQLFEKLRSYNPCFERREARVPYYVHVTIKDENGIYYGMTGDISGKGLFVATFDKLPAKGEVRLSFPLPEDESSPVEAKGRVVWLNSKDHPISSDLPEGFGVEFTSISREEFVAIKEFIDASRKKGSLRH